MRIIDTQIKYIHDPDDDLSAEEHEEKCCEEKPGIECGKSGKVEAWNGAEDQEHWPARTKQLIKQAEEDPLLEIRYKSRKLPCGYKETKWKGSENCCANVPALSWVRTYTDLEWNEEYVFIVEGGAPPYQWSVQGAGLSISGSGSSAILSVSDCFCEPGQIIVTDACDQQIVHGVTSENGSWVEITEEECDLEFPVRAQTINLDHGGKTATYQDDRYRVVQGHDYWTGAGQVVSELPVNGTWDGPLKLMLPEWVTPQIFLASYAGNEEHYYTYSYGYEVGPINSISGYTDWYSDPPRRQHLKRDVDLVRYYEWQCEPDFRDFLYDDENSADVIADWSEAWIRVEGGKPPFTVNVEGYGFWVESGYTQKYGTFQNREIKIYASDACGHCYVTVEDSCGSIVTGDLKSTSGNWEYLGEFRPRTQIYVEEPDVYDCVTNSYAWDTSYPTTQYKREYAMSEDIQSPEEADQSWVFQGVMGRWCSYKDMGETFYMDPVVGMFEIPGTLGYNHGPWGDPSFWRIGVAVAHHSNQSLYFHKWGC